MWICSVLQSKVYSDETLSKLIRFLWLIKLMTWHLCRIWIIGRKNRLEMFMIWVVWNKNRGIYTASFMQLFSTYYCNFWSCKVFEIWNIPLINLLRYMLNVQLGFFGNLMLIHPNRVDFLNKVLKCKPLQRI